MVSVQGVSFGQRPIKPIAFGERSPKTGVTFGASKSLVASTLAATILAAPFTATPTVAQADEAQAAAPTKEDAVKQQQQVFSTINTYRMLQGRVERLDRMAEVVGKYDVNNDKHVKNAPKALDETAKTIALARLLKRESGETVKGMPSGTMAKFATEWQEEIASELETLESKADSVIASLKKFNISEADYKAKIETFTEAYEKMLKTEPDRFHFIVLGALSKSVSQNAQDRYRYMAKLDKDGSSANLGEKAKDHLAAVLIQIQLHGQLVANAEQRLAKFRAENIADNDVASELQDMKVVSSAYEARASLLKARALLVKMVAGENYNSDDSNKRKAAASRYTTVMRATSKAMQDALSPDVLLAKMNVDQDAIQAAGDKYRAELKEKMKSGSSGHYHH